MRWLALIPVVLFLLAWWGYVTALPYNELPYDDSYIAQQYARFALDTGMLTFDGVHPSNGATSPPHVILLAVARKVIGDSVWAARLLGVILHSACLFCLYSLLLAMGCRKTVALLVSCAAAVCGFLVVDSLNGLETSLFHLLSVAFIWLALRAQDKRDLILLIAVGWLLAWCRPEGMIMLAAGLPFILRRIAGIDIPKSRKWIVVGLLFLVPAIVLIEQLRPGQVSSWQIKMDFHDEVSWPIGEKLRVAGRAVFAFLYFLRWFLVIPFIAFFLRFFATFGGRAGCNGGGCLSLPKEPGRPLGLWGLVYVSLFYGAYTWCLPSSLGYLDFRYQHVLLPWFFLTTAWGFDYLLSSICSDSVRKAAFALLVVPLLFGSIMTYVGSRIVYVSCVRSVGNVLIPLARRMERMAAPGDKIATHDVGVLGFHSGLPIVDLVGLTDPRASERLDRKLDYGELVLSSGRGYLIVHPSWDEIYFHIEPERAGSGFEYLFQTDSAFGDRYSVYRFGL